MTNYQRGNAYERRVRIALQRDGYTVWQSRGSKTPADLIAVKPRQVVLVQVKSGEAQISHDGWNALWELAETAGALAVVADRDGRCIRYREIIGLHTLRSRYWPCKPWRPDEVLA